MFSVPPVPPVCFQSLSLCVAYPGSANSENRIISSLIGIVGKIPSG